MVSSRWAPSASFLVSRRLCSLGRPWLVGPFPVSASLFTRSSSLCVSGHVPFSIRTPVIGVGPTPVTSSLLDPICEEPVST